MGEIVPGTLPYMVLVYSVSEPGEWRTDDIAEDLQDADLDQIRTAVEGLEALGLVHRNTTDQRLWPLRAGREALQRLPA